MQKSLSFYLFLILFPFFTPQVIANETLKDSIIIEELNQMSLENPLIVSIPSSYTGGISIFFKFPKSFLDNAFDLLQDYLSKNHENTNLIRHTADKDLFIGEIPPESPYYSNFPEKNQMFKILATRFEYKISKQEDDSLIKTWYIIIKVPGLEEIHQKYPSHFLTEPWPSNNEFSFEIAQQETLETSNLKKTK